MLHSVWHFLVGHHLYDALVSWGVAAVCGVVLRFMVIDNWHSLMREQERIADLLDTTTPGGLGDLTGLGHRGSGDEASGGRACSVCQAPVEPEHSEHDA